VLETLEAAELVEEIAAPLRASQPGVTLTVTALPPVESDRGALVQLLTQVLENAVRHRRADVAHQVEVSAQIVDDSLTFRIKDNGRGIAAADMRRVFRPFVRVAPLDDEREGIGLANARALARRLGGELTVESTVNEGSTFVLELPRHAPSKYPRSVA
jgi:signal transduction histidine kinase